MGLLIITNNTISHEHQVIKTANISSIDLRETKVENTRLLLIIGVISGVYALSEISTITNGNIISGFKTLAVSAIISFLCFWFDKKLQKDGYNYFLMINTNDGLQDLFSHQDYDFINGIRLQIQKILDSPNDTPVNITYNLDKKTIINNPQGKITITNVNHYKGLSDNDKEYLKNYFEPALQKLQTDIMNSNNEEFKQNFDMLKQELKSTKPRKSIIEASGSVLGHFGSVSDFASIIEKVANMNF